MNDELGGFILFPPSAQMLERAAEPVTEMWSGFQPAVYILWRDYDDPDFSLDRIKGAIGRATGIDRALLRLTHREVHVPQHKKLGQLLQDLAAQSMPALHHNDKPHFQLDINYHDIMSSPVVSIHGDVAIVEVHDGTQVPVNINDFPPF